MTDQPNNGSGAAPQGTAPAPSPSGGSDFPAMIEWYKTQLAAEQTSHAETKRRSDGYQTAMNKKSDQVQAAETKIAELTATYEGEKSTFATQTADWTRRIADSEKLANEREVKLKQYDLRDTTRSLIAKDFAALLPDFDNDPVTQAGVLSLAQTADADTLKAKLTESLAAKTNGQQAAVQATLRGGSPPAPAGGAPATETLQELQTKIRGLRVTDPNYQRDYDALMDKLMELYRKEGNK